MERHEETMHGRVRHPSQKDVVRSDSGSREVRDTWWSCTNCATFITDNDILVTEAEQRAFEERTRILQLQHHSREKQLQKGVERFWR